MVPVEVVMGQRIDRDCWLRWLIPLSVPSLPERGHFGDLFYEETRGGVTANRETNTGGGPRIDLRKIISR